MKIFSAFIRKSKKRKNSRTQDSSHKQQLKKNNLYTTKKITSKNFNVKNRRFKKIKLFSFGNGIDLSFMFITLFLLIIGLVMLFSASYPYAYYNCGGDSFYFIKNQLIFAIMGVVVMLLISNVDYNIFKNLYIPILVTSYLMLILVLIMPAVKGVHRWIQVGSFSFQPSEITKFAIVLSFSTMIVKNFSKMNTFKYGILPFLCILIPTIILLALEPHISCTVIVVLLAGGMLFIGGIQLRWFGMILGVIASGLIYLVVFTDKLTYANERIAGWLNPFGPYHDTWQTKQGLYAIGSGGIFGLGLGNSRQKYLYIPEPQNDFIFTVVCEELGFIGAVIILMLFAMLVWRGIVISIRAKNTFGTLLGIGLTAQVGLQVILNIAVVTNTIPNTGISLPFFSYGGTSLLMLLFQMGIILSISRTAKIETN